MVMAEWSIAAILIFVFALSVADDTAPYGDGKTVNRGHFKLMVKFLSYRNIIRRVVVDRPCWHKKNRQTPCFKINIGNHVYFKKSPRYPNIVFVCIIKLTCPCEGTTAKCDCGIGARSADTPPPSN